MARASTKARSRTVYEWQRGLIANIGTVTTFPFDILFHHVKDKNLYDVVGLFFSNDTVSVDFLDICALESFWWINSDIESARYSKIDNPVHYAGEYIFDLYDGTRTIIEIRQPDLDGRHWDAEHFHIIRGTKHPENSYQVIRTTYKTHISITGGNISGYYVMKIA